MSRLTYQIQFYCRQSKTSNKTGLAPIELSLIINGKRVFINLPRKEYPEVFKKSMETRKNNPVKDYCEEIRMKFNEIQLDMLRNNIPLTADSLKSYYKTGGVKTYTIQDLFDEYYGLLRKRVGINLSLAAYKQYLKAGNCFFKYVEPSKELSTVTVGIIDNFKADIDKVYQVGTVRGIITKIKTIFTYGKDNGRININPFINVKYSKIKKDIQYLTPDEVKLLYNLPIENKSLSDVRDAFILQASTGLAYADVYNLKKEDIQIDETGTHYIVKNRCKTNTQYVTVVLPLGVEVLKKHNYQLHIISNQKYNCYLKNIQSLTNIKTKLTTHLARKTFATTLLNSGVRVETVSKSLGHASVKQTQSAYATLLSRTVINEIKAVM